MKAQFHLALPCKSIEVTKNFYTSILGASLGRYADKWADINLYNNQLTFTQAGDFNFNFKNYKLGESVLPSFHFGVIIPVQVWGDLYTKLFKSNHEVTTEVTFMKNKIGEHLSFFITDPNGYMIEFKSFKTENEVFCTSV